MKKFHLEVVKLLHPIVVKISQNVQGSSFLRPQVPLEPCPNFASSPPCPTVTTRFFR
jgi:pyrimidine deaminase RibD-like protein